MIRRNAHVKKTGRFFMGSAGSPFYRSGPAARYAVRLGHVRYVPQPARGQVSRSKTGQVCVVTFLSGLYLGRGISLASALSVSPG